MKLQRALLDAPIYGGRLTVVLFALAFLALWIMFVMLPPDFEPTNSRGGSENIKIKPVYILDYRAVPITRNDGRLN